MTVKHFTAVKGIIRYNDKVLLLRESGQYVDGVNQGHYDVVGGHIKHGEALRDALVREILEESGLKITSANRFLSTK